MDKINIGILHHGKIKPRTGHIDIVSLVPKNKHEEYINSTSNKVINSILKRKDDTRQHIIETYEKVFKNCIDKIIDTNKLKMVDVIFEVPNAIFTLPEYDPQDCLIFLESKLRKMHFDTFKIYPYNIFISWNYFELNINDKKIIKR